MTDAKGPPLHVTNGDSTVPGLRGTGLAGEILPWRDVLHEGPVPDVDDAQLRQIRASFLSAENADDIGTAVEFAERDRILEAQKRGEYVLWFEADLYDQLQIIQILDRVRRLGVAPDRISLICIGEHVEVAHFGGLGELSAAQLARLPSAAAVTMTDAGLAHAAAAWAAFRATEPTGLRTIIDSASLELRFLAEAFERLAQEYPATRDGLSVTERRILAAIAGGAATAGEVFARIMARERRPFLGDTWCFDRMTRFLRASTPLMASSSRTSPVERQTDVRLTDNGRRVLAGEDDHVRLNGVDRWIGGVHLSGRRVAWRWDEGTESVIATDH